MKKKKILFVTFIVALLLFGFSAGVMAATNLQEIKAYLNYGLSVAKDGKVQELKDANGNTVIPITYNDTTYLPVRAISNILGVSVDWDQNTQCVLLDGSPIPLSLNPSAPPSTDTYGYLDFNFVGDTIAKYAKDKVVLTDESAKNLNADGTWIGKDYTVGNDVSYVFSGLDFVSASGNGKAVPEFEVIEAEIHKILIANGYTQTKTDGNGIKHYVRGDVEFDMWNVGGYNTTFRVEAQTGYQADCLR